MKVRVKVCGITRLEDALLAVELGADAIGFNFVEGSPRRVSPERAREIGAALPPFVTRVGVFADARPPSMEAVAELAGIQWLQLHGDESPELCAGLTRPWYKALRVTPEFHPGDVSRYGSATVLLDAFVPGRRGGTGRTFDWGLARRASAYARVIVAGGLDPDNVAEAIAAARPFAVDVSSGVESASGCKDRARLEAFMRSVRAAVREED
ncbi:MAG: phosphoribosylanthranilate isomerase [Acidobacteriota bacterium]